jgi:hypothetical protein
MARYDASHAEVVRGTLRIHVANVARLARDYSRLGLRIVEQTRERVVIVLPCGMTLVLLRCGGCKCRRNGRAGRGYAPGIVAA